MQVVVPTAALLSRFLDLWGGGGCIAESLALTTSPGVCICGLSVYLPANAPLALLESFFYILH